jgi:ABC-type antimicrobial peptide transport system permease subunit
MLMTRLREDVRVADSLFRVTSMRLQSAVVNESLLREQLLASLSTFFAGVGLALVAVGTYAVLSCAVVHRNREIGIRVALGARPLGVMRTVFTEFGSAVLAGTVFGLAGGIYLSRFVERLLFQVSPTDLLSLAVPLIALLAVVTLAAVLPAIRATRVDPVVVLHCE